MKLEGRRLALEGEKLELESRRLALEQNKMSQLLENQAQQNHLMAILIQSVNNN